MMMATMVTKDLLMEQEFIQFLIWERMKVTLMMKLKRSMLPQLRRERGGREEAQKVNGSAKKKEGPPPLVAKVVHDAAAAAAASSTFEPGIDAEAVAALRCPNDPIVSSALDAAAQLAAATQASNSLQEPNVDEDDDAKQPAEITWEV